MAYLGFNIENERERERKRGNYKARERFHSFLRAKHATSGASPKSKSAYDACTL